MIEKQHTLRQAVTVSGVGLHTGQMIHLTFRPAPENHGLVFLRKDLGSEARIAADAALVTDTTRGTTLEKDGMKVATVEHALAALTGMGVDNAIIETDGPETPILDGSARLYTEAIANTGIQAQSVNRDYFEVQEPIRFYHPEKDCEIIALPADHFRITCMIDYPSKVLGQQHASMDQMAAFEKQIAPCRTFVFLHELEYLVSNRLIKGGDLSNAIVFVDRVVSQGELDRLAKVLNRPSVAVRSEGILNTLDLHFPNEPARHKILDLIGDLALAGKPIKGHIVATKPGHASNVLFAKEIKKHIRAREVQDQIPVYNPKEKAVFDVNDIMRLLPHRPPFLLVDKIMELGDSHVVGIKNVTMNEAFFTGHFPQEPVMPGVLMIEAMAQTGGILVLSGVDEPGKYNTYFLKIENVRFKQKVVPGDTLVFKLSLISPIRRGIVHMRGVGYVGENPVVEAEMLAQVVKSEDTPKGKGS